MSIIAGIAVPDSPLADRATQMVRDTAPEFIFHHSSRVFLWGALQAEALRIEPDPELLYVASMFHNLGLVPRYRTETQRFEMDGADEAAKFLEREGLDGAPVDTVWAAIALHTTPEVPYALDPVIAATAAGVETDVLGLHRHNLTASQVAAVVTAHPRRDFKNRILHAFTEGNEHRPDSTFGTINLDVLKHFIPGFVQPDFVETVRNSHWPE